MAEEWTGCHAADDLVAVIRDEFALLPSETPAAFIRNLGSRIRALENALESDIHTCPECGVGTVAATVVDSVQGVVYIEGSCCPRIGGRITAAALERHRAMMILGGQT